MKKHILLPLLALAGGSAGLVLHRWELSLAADTATGLLNSGQPATAVLAVLTIALAAALALLCRGGSAPKDWRDGLRCPLSGWVALMVAAALLLLACGGLTVSSAIQRLALWRMDPDRNTLPIMDGLLALSCLPAALAVLKLGQGGYRGSLTQEDRWMTALPGYAAVFWAVSTYQQNAISPYPMQYAWATLSCVCLLLAFYFFAAGAFGARLSGLFPLFALVGIVLDLIAMGDPELTRLALLQRTAFLLTALGLVYPALHARSGPAWTEEELARSLRQRDEEDPGEETDE